MFKVFVSSLLVLSSTAMASSAQYKSEYYLRFHFSDVAFNKVVKSVMVHAGGLVDQSTIYETPRPEWHDVKDVLLTKIDDHFFGTAKVTSTYYISSGGLRKVAPVVQYWVTFEDGTTTITEAFDVPVVKSLRFVDTCTKSTSSSPGCIDPWIVGGVEIDFRQATDASYTFAEEIQYYHVN